VHDPRLRAAAEVVLLPPTGRPSARGSCSRCVPVKARHPQLNAQGRTDRDEELQVAYETLRLVPPT
jgi:hypothetical protein